MFVGPPGLHVYGVRHHSPACARLVASAIRAIQPKHVLIEGPADLNDRLDELLLEHELPIAIFSSYRDGVVSHASWSPFCAYSPEWVALHEGRKAGAQVRFMDLPAWDPTFHGVANRYADRRKGRGGAAIQALCEQFGVEGLDALWDHLFEQPSEESPLIARLRAYFEAIREDRPATDEDAAREGFMRANIEAALAEGGPVLVVCGGYHAPFLAKTRAAANAQFPQPPRHDAAKSFLVPYSFRRLDAFTGYQSGMPSPAYYQAVWDDGPEGAPDRMLRAAVEALRRRGQHVSAADLIAASTMAEGLARLRGHRVLARSDLLDGIAAALVKDSLEAALPWSQRGFISPDTDPLIAEVLRAFSGERRGRLDQRTPRPPLLHDVETCLRDHGLLPGPRPRRVTLALEEAEARQKSRILHRLRVLGLPGVKREQGPRFPTDPVLDEHWTLSPNEDFASAVIEASGYGATLEQAAAGRLEEALVDPEVDLEKLSLVLAETLFAAVPALQGPVLARVAIKAGSEPELTQVGVALERLLSVWRHDVLLGAKESAELGALIAALLDRGLWLMEHLDGPTLPANEGHLRAVSALRDALRHAAPKLSLDEGAAAAVFHRRFANPRTPPALRGASLGALWSLPRAAADVTEDTAIRAIRGAALPASLGDFLAGLFRLAREQTVRTPSITRVLDELVSGMREDDFLVAIPSLRLAFSYFPPQEKAEVARAVLSLHGRSLAEAYTLVRPLQVAVAVTAQGTALDSEVDRVLERYALKREVSRGT